MRAGPIVFLVTALLLQTSSSTMADDDAERARALSGSILPLAQILRTISPRYPGKVIEVDLDDDDDPEYQIRILDPNGRIVELEVDARTGRVLDVDMEDDD
ncbi:PepSY domain-containing protein [Limoniibacter endophyticus]|uniref:PepSY domain-containing protein n=1 Tax=Limoniibacter endophyticus TaxID=1565040 RepID=A0A8J3DPR2_9HYPH|nr:PepSY domain-containing protein [Limoniibacter endophyticus]GHC77946.1 hypothetical protein GCM10010136_29510 [Limoniibacter endophyticus]